ncbi:hypothetical protein BGZ73_004065 [Actinomortierella ambigua]|nr:hypothetical protein BGZ73_004065 [Actinomortierella ambigua]
MSTYSKKAYQSELYKSSRAQETPTAIYRRKVDTLEARIELLEDVLEQLAISTGHKLVQHDDGVKITITVRKKKSHRIKEEGR